MPKYNVKRAFYGKNNKRRLRKVASAFKRIASSAAKSAARSARREASAASKQLTVDMLAGSGDYRIKKYITGRHGFDKVGRQRGGTGSATGHHAARADIGKGCMRIKHTEYIGDLVATNPNFQSQIYGLNPGDSGTFPWLSSLAVNFQHYKFRKLVFEYRPLVSEGTTAAQNQLLSMGAVMMATQYDSVAGPYPNKATMAESDFAVTSKPSEHMLHAIECEPKYNPLGILYVSGNQDPTYSGVPNADVRMQNLGIFQIANQGVPFPQNPEDAVNSDLGEIWVHYEVDLFKPQLNAGLTNLLSCHYNYYLNPAVGIPGINGVFGGNITDDIQPASAPGSLLRLYWPNTNTFAFPVSVTTGNFMVVFRITKGGHGFALDDVTTPVVTNGSCIRIWNLFGALDGPGDGDGQPDQQTWCAAPYQVEAEGGHPAAWFNMVQAFIVSVNAPGAAVCAVTLEWEPEGQDGRDWEMFVTPINSNIVT